VISDLKELRVRLETHLDILADENQGEPTTLGLDMLSAIDLLNIMETGNWKTVEEVLKAWQSRDEESGKFKPKLAPPS
jgi:hypothetical protein